MEIQHELDLVLEIAHLALEICPFGKLLDNIELYRHLFLKLYQLWYYFDLTF